MSADQGKVDKAVAAYQKKFGRLPKDMETLVAYTAQKEPGVPKLTKKKHGELITESLEAAKAAAAAGGKKKKGGKKKAATAAAAAAEEEEEAPAEEEAPPKKKAPKQEYAIDTTVLLSSDRIGIVRWFGFLPSRKGYFYGVEFLGSFAGNCDGAVDGVRYFQTAEDRAKFFPPAKIRKAASQKDMVKILGHERSQSWLARNTDQASGAAAEPELAAVDESGGDDAKAAADDDDEEEEKAPPAADDDDDDDDEDDEEEEPVKPVKKKAAAKKAKGRPARSSTVVDQIEVEVVSSRETELEFILRQCDNTRELLLDIYCNPGLSQLFVSAFEQVKTLDIADQPEVWKDLISRWRLHL